MPPNLQPVAGLIPEHQKQQIEALGGEAGVSAGLRTAITAGLLALQGDCALIRPIDELRDLASRLARIQGRRTPAGAWWAPTPEALPTAEQLDHQGTVLVMPQSVGLLAAGALVVDLADGVITASNAETPGAQITAAIGLDDLVAPAALLPAALTGLAIAGPGRRELGLGLAIERTGGNHFLLTLQGAGARCDADLIHVFAAELLGLLARSARASLATRQQLNRALAEVTP
jgi:hypothetical protein